MADQKPVSPDSAVESTNILLARQPIFTPELKVYGYELLYRSANELAADLEANDEVQRNATIKVVVNAIMDIGVESVAGEHLAFFNIPAEMLMQGLDLPFGGSKIGLDLLDYATAGDDLKPALESLRLDDVVLALDDFRWSENQGDFLDLIDIVKVDISAADATELAVTLEKLSGYNCLPAAKKVETREQFEACRELGFELFQGFFLSKPELIETGKLPDSKMNILRLISRLQDPEIQAREVEQVIRQDVTLHFRLLRTVNSAYFGLPVEIKSISHAVAYLGLPAIQKWAYLQLIASSDETPGELIRQSLIRARMSELLTHAMPREAQDKAFTVGLFSLLDSLLGISMDQVLDQLPVDEILQDALTRHDGPYGRLLKTVINYEQGRWQQVGEGMYETNNLAKSYLEAVQWAGEQYQLLSQPN